MANSSIFANVRNNCAVCREAKETLTAAIKFLNFYPKDNKVTLEVRKHAVDAMREWQNHLDTDHASTSN